MDMPNNITVMPWKKKKKRITVIMVMSCKLTTTKIYLPEAERVKNGKEKKVII